MLAIAGRTTLDLSPNVGRAHAAPRPNAGWMPVSWIRLPYKGRFMALARLGQIAIPVSDPDRAEALYGGTLGLTKLFRFGTLVFFDCAGVRLMLEGSTKSVKPTDGVCHYFRVDSVHGRQDQQLWRLQSLRSGNP